MAAKPDEGGMRPVSHIHKIPRTCAGLNCSRGANLTPYKASSYVVKVAFHKVSWTNTRVE